MASDETMTIHSSIREDEFDYEIDDSSDSHQLDHQPHPHNLSRLSVCTSSTMCELDDYDDEDVDNALKMYLSRLSVESFDGDGDADEELSDGKELPTSGLSSESENGWGSFYSLPATPPRRRNRSGMGTKDYLSENEAQKRKSDTRRRRSSRIKREGGMFDKAQTWETVGDYRQKDKKKEEAFGTGLNFSHSFSGGSDQGSVNGNTGFIVITRPKGGTRSLCMDLDEVKACRDLGFELEHERLVEFPTPTHRSYSNSTLDTNSGGNSPIANWRISSPGDDPRDVKARLRVWAQAVALASTSSW